MFQWCYGVLVFILCTSIALNDSYHIKHVLSRIKPCDSLNVLNGHDKVINPVNRKEMNKNKISHTNISYLYHLNPISLVSCTSLSLFFPDISFASPDRALNLLHPTTVSIVDDGLVFIIFSISAVYMSFKLGQYLVK